MTRATTLTLALAALFLAAASPAAADTRVAELLPTDGLSFPAWGVAETTTNHRCEDFMVRVDAAVGNGTTLVVYVIQYGATGEDWIQVAKTPVQLGTALVAMCTLKDVSEAFPVDNVAGIQVRLRGKVVLEGWFTR
jgi:hypothetical protein